MHILVTGAGGFVGRYVIEELKNHGHEVTACILEGESSCHVKTIVLNICDRDAVVKAIARDSYDGILHLAAISHVGESELSIANLVNVNVNGTGNLLHAISTANVKSRLVFVSSSQVFSSNGISASLDESSPTNPETPYGWSKLTAENLCQLYRSIGHDIVIVRPFNHIGPGQRPDFVVAGLAKRIKATPDGGVLQVGNLETFRDFTDVRDIVRGYRLILEAENPSPIYVFGSGRCLRIREILEALVRISGKTLSFEVDASLMRKVDPVRFVANYSLADNEVNWRPEFDLNQTLEEIYRLA